MKNTKTKIILSAIIFLSVAGFVATADAAGSSLYVSPASLTKTVGDTLNVSVGVNASGSKVCAAEGTLVFNNLTCQNITVAGDVTPQSSPTCSNSHFLIGVPSCTIADKALFTVSVKAGNAGTSSIGFTGVDIIGEGVSVSNASVGGNYNITAPVVVQQPVIAQQKEPSVIKTQPEETEETPEEVATPQQEETTSTPVVAANPEVNVAQASLLTATVNILSFGTGEVWLAIIVIILIILVLAILYFVGKKNRKKS